MPKISLRLRLITAVVALPVAAVFAGVTEKVYSTLGSRPSSVQLVADDVAITAFWAGSERPSMPRGVAVTW